MEVPSAAAALLRAAAARARAASALLRALAAGRAEEGRPILGSADSARARKPSSASALEATLSSARRVAWMREGWRGWARGILGRLDA